ncbi:MAG TPA: lytic transglycosylase domain-containing protein [Anaeromyxobacteraceae bacterium]|nr:lytic transglycosylase domain-containing protein [Anaeromyxobacteraceae bacterium]
MPGPTLRGLAGAALAVGGFAAALAVPRPLDDGPRPMAPAEREPPVCALDRPCVDARREAWVERVDGQLAARLPGADDAERFHLAETIVAEAQAARIDPLLVLAIVEVESAFDTRALSGAGARGLMQLMPSTMRSEEQRSGLAPGDPHDPVANVQAGIRYFRRLLDVFGREDVALMAYNAGPNQILGYLREGRVPDIFRAYPRRVKAELRRLRRSLGVEPAPAVADVAVPTVFQ